MKTVAFSFLCGAILVGLIGFESYFVTKLAGTAAATAAQAHALRLGAAPGPGVSQVTWGTKTATIGNRSCILLDGGAATYVSDAVPVSGYVGAASGGCFFTCSVPGAAAVEDSFQAQVSNDGNLYGTLSQAKTWVSSTPGFSTGAWLASPRSR